MKYISTRGNAPVLSFEEAMLSGLARDGGLYVPQTIPQMSSADIAALAGQSYEEIAFRVMKPFVGDCFSDAELMESITAAYANFGHAARAPLVQLGPNHHLLELFHGPTLAFKDFAMQLIGQLFQKALTRRGERVTIVGATSGDTGSAAIEAFRGLDVANVFILFPNGRVSEVQRRQMTTPADANVHAIAMEGTFDTCQAMLKDMFNDFEFRDGVKLAGVNSINWARVLALVVYYFSAATSLGAPHRKVSFTVPTGNFGDIYAGYVAKKMGLPIDKLIVATNENDILQRVINTGEYKPDKVKPSLSPSMDIQISSNFERLLFNILNKEDNKVRDLMNNLNDKGSFKLDDKAINEIKKDFEAVKISDEETLSIIKNIYDKENFIVDPHTATAFGAVDKIKGINNVVVLGTAHPYKFLETVKKATGKIIKTPSQLEKLVDKEEKFDIVENNIKKIKKYILNKIQ